MGSKIKAFLWGHRTDIFVVLIVLLALAATFQMGRLSVIFNGTSQFQVYDRS
jgi:divalent metal cation (Fe/Co/Zn/Cd) transporter